MEEKDKEIETQSLQEEDDDDEDDDNFVDFDDDYAADVEETPQLDDDLIEEVPQEVTEQPAQAEEAQEPEEELQRAEVLKKEQEENNDIPERLEDSDDVAWWEDIDKTNSVVKKYIFNISKDLTYRIDELSAKERNSYINSAIRLKMEQEDEMCQTKIKQKMTIHLILLLVIFICATPLALFVSHKAIMLTFKNYKYSQENFEKLYKERFLHDSAYLRSIQHNRKYNVDK